MKRIHLLSPRLANQIAAGEVVERPANIIKELVENSLDAGAQRIEIDVEQGGIKLLRIRDDGHGIPKDDLPLALSRHATSKITTLDDLEAVHSLGFRGEALASISSVSRLTLTSAIDPEDNQPEQAWQVEVEGREMAAMVKPAAHPKGTTLEVRDLFFNTPARRKFLRTEKTEFNHVDECFKRLALSRYDVAFSLRHNQKVIHSLRPAIRDIDKEKRVAALLGTKFIDAALHVDSAAAGLGLTGWVGLLGSEYGFWLLLKIALVGLILVLAGVHKLFLVPAILTNNNAQRLATSLLFEKLLGMSILAVTTVLTTLVGPAH